jgi:alpha-amylase
LITQSDIIYFLLTDRFYDGDQENNYDVDCRNPLAYHGGDFKGIVEKIPYLKNLGVSVIWMTPVYVNIHLPEERSWGYHGYWTLDFESVDDHLYSAEEGVAKGSKEYLRKLVDILHHNGLKLILDVIVNHVGYNHPGLRGEPETKIKPKWFNPRGRYSEEELYLYGLPDLDHDKAEVADYFVNNILDWIEATGVNGIRMDAVKHVERAFWYHFKNYVRGRYPNVSVIAEVLDMDVGRVSRFQRYFAFDSLFDFPLQQAIWEVFIHDKSLNLIARPRLHDDEPKGVLDKDTLYTNHNRLIVLLDNHDLKKRFFSETFDRYGGDKEKALKVFKIAITFLLTTRGIPQIYYGTEIAMEGYSDPDNRRDMRWEIFNGGLEPSDEYPLEKEAFKHVKKLIALRNRTPALQYASLLTLYADYFVYVYLREFRGDNVIVIINNGHEPMPLPLNVDIGVNSNIPPRIKKNLEGRKLVDKIDLNNPPIHVINGRFEIQLTGKTAAVYMSSTQ